MKRYVNHPVRGSLSANGIQIYRKAAFKIVTDLGEEALPEPATQSEDGKVQSVETVLPDVKPASEHLPGDSSPRPGQAGTETAVTTEPRQAIQVPEGVSVRITQDTLKDYVGP